MKYTLRISVRFHTAYVWQDVFSVKCKCGTPKWKWYPLKWKWGTLKWKWGTRKWKWGVFLLSFIDRDKNCIKGGVKSQTKRHPFWVPFGLARIVSEGIWTGVKKTCRGHVYSPASRWTHRKPITPQQPGWNAWNDGTDFGRAKRKSCHESGRIF